MTTLRRNTTAALFGATAFVVMFMFGIPLLPSAAFLKYEPSGMIILTSTVLLGPVGGVFACFLKDAVFMLVGGGNIFGVTSDFINTAVYALAAGMVIRRGSTLKNHLLGYLVGTLAGTLVMIPVNLVILQLEFGMTPEAIMGMMLPAILPFNVLKGLCNGLVYHLAGRPILKILKAHQTVNVA
ncbi:MAG: ECF transporter S component [Oscillospiraceae bacterium]|jgi:riboflavin transporter FmnP